MPRRPGSSRCRQRRRSGSSAISRRERLPVGDVGADLPTSSYARPAAWSTPTWAERGEHARTARRPQSRRGGGRRPGGDPAPVASGSSDAGPRRPATATSDAVARRRADADRVAEHADAGAEVDPVGERVERPVQDRPKPRSRHLQHQTHTERDPEHAGREPRADASGSRATSDQHQRLDREPDQVGRRSAREHERHPDHADREHGERRRRWDTAPRSRLPVPPEPPGRRGRRTRPAGPGADQQRRAEAGGAAPTQRPPARCPGPRPPPCASGAAAPAAAARAAPARRARQVARGADGQHPPPTSAATYALSTRIRNASISMSKRAPNAETVPVRRATPPSTASSAKATAAGATTQPGGTSVPNTRRPSTASRRRSGRANVTSRAGRGERGAPHLRVCAPTDRYVRSHDRAIGSVQGWRGRPRPSGCASPGTGEIRPEPLPEPGPGRGPGAHAALRRQPRHRDAGLRRPRAGEPARPDAGAVPGGRLPGPGEVRLPQRRRGRGGARRRCAAGPCSASTRTRPPTWSRPRRDRGARRRARGPRGAGRHGRDRGQRAVGRPARWSATGSRWSARAWSAAASPGCSPGSPAPR